MFGKTSKSNWSTRGLFVSLESNSYAEPGNYQLVDYLEWRSCELKMNIVLFGLPNIAFQLFKVVLFCECVILSVKGCCIHITKYPVLVE